MGEAENPARLWRGWEGGEARVTERPWGGEAAVCRTCVDKASWRPLAKLLRLVGERNLHDPRNVPRGCLDSDGVGRDQLQRDKETTGHCSHQREAL